ncbi:MAG TPA: TRAP transporter small permease [Burkholderiales bacterium]|nr:TRAP transporter small permease [Burkholderiales bacterium]
MKFFVRIHAWLEKVSRVAVWIGGAALLLCAFMVSIDVVMRKLFSITMSGSDEISGYAFAAATAWAYSYTLLHRSHIRIDAIYGVLPVWLRSVLDAIGLALLLYYMGYLTNKAIDVFLTSWEHDSVSITTLSVPQWIPQLLWLGGLCWFVITLAFLLVYVLVSLLLRDVATVQNVAGALSAEKKIDEETQGMDAMR